MAAVTKNLVRDKKQRHRRRRLVAKRIEYLRRLRAAEKLARQQEASA